MSKILTTLALSLFVLQTFAQNFEDLNFGTDSTLEIMTWNIESFPKNNEITTNYLSQIIQALDIDIIAIQEIDSTEFFTQLVNNLDGYDGYYGDNSYIKLGYIYKTDLIEITDTYVIFPNNYREFLRTPSIMEFTFMDDNYMVINNHFKCCGDGILDPTDSWDQETRRYDASVLLDEYIGLYNSDDKVIIVGDLNDILTDDEENNVFQIFLDKPDKYKFADIDIAEGASTEWSYPSWTSHLDHILITNELFEDFENEGSDIQTIKLDEYFTGGWDEYEENISDHRPVALKIKPISSGSNISGTTINNSKFSIHPNPAKESATFSISPASKNTRIEIYNTNGQIIKEIIPEPNQISVKIITDNLPAGLYLAKLKERNTTLSTRKLLVVN